MFKTQAETYHDGMTPANSCLPGHRHKPRARCFPRYCTDVQEDASHAVTVPELELRRQAAALRGAAPARKPQTEVGETRFGWGVGGGGRAAGNRAIICDFSQLFFPNVAAVALRTFRDAGVVCGRIGAEYRYKSRAREPL